MSYDIGIYHPSVRDRVEGGEEMDEFDHPQLDAAAVRRFIEALAGYGYGVEPSTSECRAFAKTVSDSRVQVHVFATEIAFSVPYGKNSKDAIFEALQDASELIEPEHMCVFDPQTGQWLDA
jgi:hypothetical protein